MYLPKIKGNSLWLILFVVVLSCCQASPIYSNSRLGFSIEHPKHWEIDQVKEDTTGTVFYAKDTGDATIWIQVFNELSAPTALESLQIRLGKWISKNDIQVLSDIDVSTPEHPRYDMAVAELTIQAFNPAFKIDYYVIVMQTTDRMAVVLIGGDGTEPTKAAQIIIDSFEFLP